MPTRLMRAFRRAVRGIDQCADDGTRLTPQSLDLDFLPLAKIRCQPTTFPASVRSVRQKDRHKFGGLRSAVPAWLRGAHCSAQKRRRSACYGMRMRTIFQRCGVKSSLNRVVRFHHAHGFQLLLFGCGG
ncbi:hypothetical protein [Pantoea stewartii]|uniref:hypothetical protein n=1 Tax=Pantoea stewartii TaxID=66269 RepID=UPI0025A18B03|nr:hypothetical protein [Pantoea stewartii]